LWLCVFAALPIGDSAVIAGELNSRVSSEAAQETADHERLLTASWWWSAFNSRTRIIQVTTLAVIVGIFILQWRRT